MNTSTAGIFKGVSRETTILRKCTWRHYWSNISGETKKHELRKDDASKEMTKKKMTEKPNWTLSTELVGLN